MTPTAARPQIAGGSSHWYDLQGTPCHTVPKKDGTGDRATTLADARKHNWLPSVTSILKILHKEALVNWRIEQAVLAIVTAKRLENEADDAFVHRVLHVEKQQEQEAQIARDKGTEIHDAIETYFSGLEVPADMEPWVRPVLDALVEFGERASSEVILVGDDYAGQADLLQDCKEWWRIWDFKGTKNLPDPAKGAWFEHRLQLSAYAMALQNKLRRAGQMKPILVGNIYISSINAGQYVICEHENWEETYQEGFAPLVRHWQWVNRYRPENPQRAAAISTSVSTEGALQHMQAENGKLKTELEQLRAQVAVSKVNAAVPQPEAKEPPASEPEPAVVPTAVQELKKQGRRVAWSSGTPTAPVNTPVVATGPGRPSPLIEKEPPLPPGVTPRRLVNGPNGPVMQ